MIDDTIVAHAVQAAVAVCAILLVYRFALIPLLCDVFRQRIFRLRRQLLLLRIDGMIPSTDDAYTALYRRMNGLIRGADGISFGRLLMVILVPPPSELRLHNEFELALKSTAPDVQAHIRRLNDALGYELVRHILITSPLAWAFLPMAQLLYMARVTRNLVGRVAHSLANRPAIRILELTTGDTTDEFARVT